MAAISLLVILTWAGVVFTLILSRALARYKFVKTMTTNVKIETSYETTKESFKVIPIDRGQFGRLFDKSLP